jgi:hypothetical protein
LPDCELCGASLEPSKRTQCNAAFLSAIVTDKSGKKLQAIRVLGVANTIPTQKLPIKISNDWLAN